VRDQSALARARDWSALLRDTISESDNARAAYEKLKTEPTSADAKAAIARWLCCWRDDWNAGLPFLTESADRALADLARRDISGAADSAAAFELAGAWWTYSEKAARPWNTAAQARAAYWYGKAAPLLTGLQKTLSEKRLAEAAESIERYARITFNNPPKNAGKQK
jgi:hypothetical protein